MFIKTINPNQWITDMLSAVRNMGSLNKLNLAESGRLAGSVVKPIPENIPPFNLFLSYQEYQQFLSNNSGRIL